MITRKSSQKLSQTIEKKEEFNNVILIEGARQVGKTTLIRETLKNLKIPFKEFNLEEQKILTEKIDLCQDFNQFTELVQVEMKFQPGKKEVLFIDEAQESRQLGSFVRFMKEKWAWTQVVLSGSSMSRIFRDNVRYPVGRVAAIHLQPFSFEEFLTASGEESLMAKMGKIISPLIHQKLLGLLEHYLEVGGLPEVVTTYFKGGDWKEIRKNILLGYYNDFKRVFGEERQPYFIAGLKAVSGLLGSPFKNSHVATLLGGGKNQEIIKCLGQLEAWKMLLTVEQKGPAAETQFHPKRYLFDTGIAKQLREASSPDISLRGTLDPAQRTPLGGLMENVMANALFSTGQELTGWKKSSSGSEVDFIAKKGLETISIECKAALKIKNTHLGGVLDFMETYQTSTGIVATLAPLERRKFSGGRTIVVLPLYLAERWEGVL